ncbi:MAG: lysine--tRNA ligase [Chloroflexi bacterium]|nr:lysine--tRNA ligase [Chloroflexota bacterium]
MWQPTKLELERLDKAERLRAMGVELYPARAGRSYRIAEAVQAFLKEEEQTQADGSDAPAPIEVTVAGRIRRLNSRGKVSFAHIEDESGRVQLFLRVNALGEGTYQQVRRKLIDVDDFVQASGEMMRTRAGEVSVSARELRLISKALTPLPVVKEQRRDDGSVIEYGEFKDVESRYRQRYADLAVNRSVRDVFVKRARTIKALRDFLDNEGMLEVETPILQPLYGGAAARPFVTHHNQLHQDLYLRISFELYLKRLLVGGYDAVYEIGRDFRNEGVSYKHNTEFTMLEFYKAYIDYAGVMDITERMFAYTAEQVTGSARINYQGEMIDLSPPWKRLSIREAVQETLGFDYMDYPCSQSLYGYLEGRGLADGLDPSDTWGRMIVEHLLGSLIEPRLIQPTIIKDYPRDMSPFAKRIQAGAAIRDEKERRFIDSHTERFEFFIAGMEMGNAFTELNDPRDQQDRFVEMKRLYADEADETTPLDEDYLNAMRYGMPPNGGFGSGVDRMVMLLTDQVSIRDVLLYPHLRAPAPTESDLRGQFMLDAAVRQLEVQLDLPLAGAKRKLALYLPAADVGVEFRMSNALEGALPQLQNMRRAFSGRLYVMTEERIYRVDDALEETDFAEFWQSLSQLSIAGE